MTDDASISIHEKLLQLKPEEMQQIIDSLAPKPDMEVGIKFLTAVLKEHGVAGVVDAVERGAHVLDKEGRFYPYDFNKGGDLDAYANEYKQVNPNLMMRRNFLRIATWAVGGAVLVANQGTKQGGKLWAEVDKARGIKNPEENPLQKSYKFIQEKGPYDFGELMIGLGITAEAISIWRDTKLENIANAVSQTAKTKTDEKDAPVR